MASSSSSWSWVSPPEDLPGHGRVEQHDGGAREVDPLQRPGGVGLAEVGVVVAAHVGEPVAEGTLVGVEEGGVLLVGAVGGEVALGEHGVDVGGLDLGDRGLVHRDRVRRFAGLRLEDRPDRVLVALDDPAADLAEVDVVDGGEAGQELTARVGHRLDLDAVEVVHAVGLQALVAPSLGAVVDDDQVGADGGDLDGHGRGYQGRLRRSGTGWLHQRPEKRQRLGRPVRARRRPGARRPRWRPRWRRPPRRWARAGSARVDATDPATAARCRACGRAAPRAWTRACRGRR